MSNMRIWYERTEPNGLKAIATRAPLTLGHTQLSFSGVNDEAAQWTAAAPHVNQLITTLKRVLNAPGAADDPRWESVSAFTRSSGEYVKTLVLRTSADEDPGTFKLHLVPYFASHASLAADRFIGAHGDLGAAFRSQQAAQNKAARGGLIGWLGDCETRVDHEIEIPARLDRPHADTARYEREIAALAAELRAAE